MIDKQTAEETLARLIEEASLDGSRPSELDRQFLFGAVWVLQEAGVLTTDDRKAWYSTINALPQLAGIQEGPVGPIAQRVVNRRALLERKTVYLEDGRPTCPKCDGDLVKARPAVFIPEHLECSRPCCSFSWVPIP